MAQRTNLRAFQEQLIERLGEARSGQSVSARLGFKLHEQDWLVDLTSIEEVLPVPSMDTVPLTRPWYAGVANIRGNLYSVVDLAVFCGLPPVEVTRTSRILMIKKHLLGGSALLVSAIAGLRNPSTMRSKVSAGKPWIRAIHSEQSLDTPERLWHEIDLAALIRQREFLEVAQ